MGRNVVTGKIIGVCDRFGNMRLFKELTVLCRELHLEYDLVRQVLYRNGEWYNSVYRIQLLSVERNPLRKTGHLTPFTDAMKVKST